jgi:hypothetical protein
VSSARPPLCQPAEDKMAADEVMDTEEGVCILDPDVQKR